MIQHEDTVAGSADISGDPPPPRPLTGKEMAGAQKAQVNHMQRGPQVPKGIAKAEEKAAGDKPSAAPKSDANPAKDTQQPADPNNLGADLQQMDQTYKNEAQQQSMLPGWLRGSNFYLNVGYRVDPWYQLSMARHQYHALYDNFLNPDAAVIPSLRNMQERSDALGYISRNLTSMSSPAVAADIYYRETQGRPATDKEKFDWANRALGSTLRMTGDPMNIPLAMIGDSAGGLPIGPRLGLDAFSLTGPIGMDSLMRGVNPLMEIGSMFAYTDPTTGQKGGLLHPDLTKPEWYADALWSLSVLSVLAVGGRFGLRMYGGQLDKFTPEFIQLGKTVDRQTAVTREAQAKAQNARLDPRVGDPTTDWLQIVHERAQLGVKDVLAKGVSTVRGVAERDPLTGNVQTSFKEARGMAQEWEKRFGSALPENIAAHLAEHGPITGEDAKWVIKNWQSRPFNHDLVYVDNRQRPLTKPTDHLGEVQAMFDPATREDFMASHVFHGTGGEAADAIHAAGMIEPRRGEVSVTPDYNQATGYSDKWERKGGVFAVNRRDLPPGTSAMPTAQRMGLPTGMVSPSALRVAFHIPHGEADPFDYLQRTGQIGKPNPEALSNYLHMGNMTQLVEDQIHRGIAMTANPMSVLRGMLGLNRGTHEAAQVFLGTVARMNMDMPFSGEDLMRAAEDPAAYADAHVLAKATADAGDYLFAAIHKRMRKLGEDPGWTSHFVPREPDRPQPKAWMQEARAGRKALTKDSPRHRAVAIGVDDEGHIQAFKAHPTVADANKAVLDQRTGWMGTIRSGELPDELKNDPLAKDLITQTIDPATRTRALARLQDLVNHYLPTFHTDWYKAMQAGLARKIRAVHSAEARSLMTEMPLSVDVPVAEGTIGRNPLTGKLRRPLMAAYKKDAIEGDGHQRIREMLRQAGYKDSPSGMDGYLVHPQMADKIDKASGLDAGLRDTPGLEQALKLEDFARANILMFPTVHGINVMDRLGTAMTSSSYWLARHPSLLGKMMKQALGTAAPIPAALTGGENFWRGFDREAMTNRMKWYARGVATPHTALEFSANLDRALADATGDINQLAITTPREDVPAHLRAAQGLVGLGKAAVKGHNPVSSLMWGLISDMGVSLAEMYSKMAIERGVEPVSAEYQGASIANTVMGHMMPEDWNPVIRDLSKLMFFAPNWRLTKLQMLAGIYRSGGAAMSKEMAMFLAERELSTTAAMFAWQKITGHVINYAMSGHGQAQNQPGHQDDIEMTAPWTDKLPQNWGVPRSDSKTGGKRYAENPVARGTREMEQLMGFESGQPGPPTAEDVAKGTASYFSSALSPLADAIGAGMNIDLYQSARDGMIRHLDPRRSEKNPEQQFEEAIAGVLLNGVPGGRQILDTLHQHQQPDPSTGLLPTTQTPALKQMLSGLPKSFTTTALQWLLGLNPAYLSAEKTRGKAIPDEDYVKAQDTKIKFQQEAATQSALMMSGGITPQAFRDWWKQHSSKYATDMSYAFQDAPEYKNGTDGLLNQWYAMYDDPKNLDPASGVIDYAKLDRSQADFKAKVSPADWDAMQKELSANDQRFHAVRLYHQTIQAKLDWQDRWARSQQPPIDPATLRQEVSDYYNASRRDQGTMKLKHKEIEQYFTAEKREWDNSPQGLMYALFYDPAKVKDYMTKQHLTEQQVETEALQAEAAG